MTNWTPASKLNPFKVGDIVVFRSRGAVPSFIVDHVESNRVFVKTELSNGRTRMVDLNSAELMLLSEWKRIYNSGN
jgi:hypothetical protein